MAVFMKKQVYIVSSATVVGLEEKDGPLGEFFHECDYNDDTFGCNTWEKAESEMQRLALGKALSFAGKKDTDIEMLFAGDLLNQCIGSNYGLLDYDISYIGLYGACSTAAEGLMLAAMLCSGEIVTTCASVASSHNASAERQFRSPLEYGGQRSPTAQWTVTGAGAFVVSSDRESLFFEKNKPEYAARITAAEPGKSLDAGINDVTNMGAAMAPAAADTILRFFKETKQSAKDFDLILTGDLGYEGTVILHDLMKCEGYDISGCHNDCGLLIYDRKRQDKHAGGSGCGCSAVVLGAYILEKVRQGKYKKLLFVGTGALMSPMSLQQGLSIPGIAHLVQIESEKL
ncbi:MAG: stage V sporulation protein AD [Clostridia bacterium]|nr:stage V sporulation protein AD [Clostridia bacterium]